MGYKNVINYVFVRYKNVPHIFARYVFGRYKNVPCKNARYVFVPSFF